MIKRNVIKKRGSLPSEAVVIFLLGFAVLVVIFYLLFNEGITSDELDLETCRQSVIIRNNLPEQDLKVSVVSFKDDFPLRCINEVITIDYKDTQKVEKEFADSLVSCWYLYGNGDFGVFPTSKWSAQSFCNICSRIHINSDVKEFYSKDENKIDFSRALSKEFKGGYTYYEYLKNVGNEDPFKYVVSGEGFNGETFEMTLGKTRVSPNFDAPGFIFPKSYDVNNGDIIILFENFISADGTINVANLFYFQQFNARHDTKSYTAIDLLSNVDRSAFVDNGWFWDGDSSVCSIWDGIIV
jgi:hypothetical protein